MAPLSDQDLPRLRRAIALAAKGRFAVEPNPVVGCVLEREGRIVGEGWHTAFGGPHAEIRALAAAGDDARGATAFVTLVPCSRAGKTGPCTDALVEAGVARVVYGADDPAEDGSGVQRLREAGLDVEGPVLEAEAAPLLDHYLRARRARVPWAVLKWAMTLDGRIAPGPGRGGRITGEPAGAWTHDLRAHVDAVAVGVETVLADDPRLTCRLVGGPPDRRPQPRRVVIDSTLRTPPDARLAADVDAAPWIVVAAQDDPARRRALEAAGAEVWIRPGPEGRVDLPAALADLKDAGVHRLLVEGGARLHGAFLRDGLADQVSAFVAPRILGADEAVPAVRGTGFDSLDGAAALREVRWRRLGDDLLVEGYVDRLSG